MTNLCGHKKIIFFLNVLLKSKNAPSTFIFSGPEHVGKFVFASQFLAALMQNKTKLVEADSREHPDILSITEPDEIKAETARKIRSFLSLSPLTGDKKGIIVDNAHLLGSTGSNILLKALEEPPYKTYSILVTNRLDLIPHTIISRSTLIRFGQVPVAELKAFVGKKLAKKDEVELKWICGRPGLLLRFLSNPDDPSVVVRRKFFHKSSATDISKQIQQAEEISKIERPHHALEGIAMSIWASSKLNTSNAKKIKSIIHAREVILRTNASVRLQSESSLLSQNE